MCATLFLPSFVLLATRNFVFSFAPSSRIRFPQIPKFDSRTSSIQLVQISQIGLIPPVTHSPHLSPKITLRPSKMRASLNLLPPFGYKADADPVLASHFAHFHRSIAPMFHTGQNGFRPAMPAALPSLLLISAALAFPELGVQLRFGAEPQMDGLLSSLFGPPEEKRRHRERDGQEWTVPLLLGTAELRLGIELQHSASAEHVTVDEPLPKLASQYDYFQGRGAQPFGSSVPYGMVGGDTVNFDFQCKCQAKSALARTLSQPTDPGQAAQQQIQQLQEQVRKLQEQINRSQQGKSSFEQFAQMLSLSDGLDCNCSGQSSSWQGWPSGVMGTFPRGAMPLSGSAQFPGGQFGGMMGARAQMGGAGQPFAGAPSPFGPQMYQIPMAAAQRA